MTVFAKKAFRILFAEYKASCCLIICSIFLVLSIRFVPIFLPNQKYTSAPIETSNLKHSPVTNRKAPDQLLNFRRFSFTDLPSPLHTAQPIKTKQSSSYFLTNTYKLVGTVLSNSLPLALVENKVSNRRYLVSIDEIFQGCELETIQSESATFKCLDNSEAALKLDVKKVQKQTSESPINSIN